MKTDAVTELILETFRFNGALLDAGDALVGELGLTSARWQVLGAVGLAPAPLPVAHIARNMGLSRQAIQRTADLLVADGLLVYRANPHHARAKLVALTRAGKRVYEAANERQRPWAAALAADLTTAGLTRALRTIRALRTTLEGTPR